MGGNRVAIPRKYFNLFFVFLVSGLWHGANWTYVIWGALHGFYNVFGQATQPIRKRINNFIGITKNEKVFKYYQVGITFVLATFAWIFFRARNVNDAFLIIRNMFSFETGAELNLYRVPADFGLAIVSIILLMAIEIYKERVQHHEELLPLPRPVRYAVITVAVLCLFILGVWEAQDFIYFQF